MPKDISKDILQFLTTIWIPIVEVLFGVIVGPWVKRLIVRMSRKSANKGLMTFIGSAANMTIIAISLIIAAEALGVKMNSVIALISALGLGVALALKGNMANVAGGIQILITKPFNVGDYIKVANHRGVVTAIELMFITIRTDNGKEIVIPNSTIVEDMIINYSKYPALRLKIPFVLPIGMDYEQVRKRALSLMKDNPYFIKDKPVDVLVTNMTSSGVEMKVVGFVLVSQMEVCKNLVYQELSRGLPYFQHGETDTEVVKLVSDIPETVVNQKDVNTKAAGIDLTNLPKPASIQAPIPQPVPEASKVKDLEDKLKEDLSLPLEPLLHPIRTIEDTIREHELEKNEKYTRSDDCKSASASKSQLTSKTLDPEQPSTTEAVQIYPSSMTTPDSASQNLTASDSISPEPDPVPSIPVSVDTVTVPEAGPSSESVSKAADSRVSEVASSAAMQSSSSMAPSKDQPQGKSTDDHPDKNTSS